MLLFGKRPFSTEVASVRIIGYIEGDNLAAASVIATLPLVILTLLFQRRLVAGLTAGAVKG